MSSQETLTSRPETVRAFLSATAKGYQYAANNAAVAADDLVQGASEHNKHAMDVEMVRESAEYMKDKFLTTAGNWGAMEAARWDKYLDWLHEAKLLTAVRQSRDPNGQLTATLDQLRDPKFQEEHQLPRSAFDSSRIFTSEFLPSAV